MTALQTADLTRLLISFAVLLQTLELLQLRYAWRETGVWKWSLLRTEHRRSFLRLLDKVLCDKGFLLLLLLRLAAALIYFAVPHPAVSGVLFLSTLFICVRWRGSFNGGSDAMTLTVLLALCVADFNRANETIVAGCLAYIAVQTATTYFLAGIAKLRVQEWRNGSAFSDFCRQSVFGHDLRLLRTRMVSKIVSWSVLVFELTFPIALASSRVATVFIAAAIIFHLGNVRVFGLNRFLFAWCAAYPSLYFFSKLL